ncbi:MAG: hypothetical protein ABI702_01950 [Burkholderiales bacterium]
MSRADLLSDLRRAAKRESCQWLSCETYYVFPAGVAEPCEIPEAHWQRSRECSISTRAAIASSSQWPMPSDSD